MDSNSGCEIELIIRTNEVVMSENSKSQSSERKLTLKQFNELILNEIVLSNKESGLRQITRLDLSHSMLSALPDSIKNLNLRELNLSHNRFESVPACILLGLKQLEDLDLSYNLIRECMAPDCINSLKTLNLARNKFKNPPIWVLLFSAANLLVLDYSFNLAENYIGYWLRLDENLRSTKLHTLILQSSCLLDSDFRLIKQIKSLKYLDISNDVEHLRYENKFSDLDLLFVQPAQGFEVLKLNRVGLSICPDGLMWIETLKELHMTENCLSWLPDDIIYLINLEILNVADNSLIALPLKLTMLKTLKIIKAATNHISVVPDFGKLTQLELLDLYDNFIEKIEFDYGSIAAVDFDQNYCDTNKLPDGYAEKKKAFRAMVPFRYDGARVIRTDYGESSCDRSSYSEESEEILVSVDVVPEEEEDWDAPEPPASVKERNPNITESDDEWNGEEVPKKQAYSTPRQYYNEDIIFKNAD